MKERKTDITILKYPRVCEVCHCNFLDARNCQRYCTKICHDKAKRLYSLICPGCGLEYKNSHKDQKYCSELCRGRDKRNLITWIENWIPAKIAGLDSPCWDCNSHTLTIHGYPQISVDHQVTRMHRYLYQELFGILPKNIFVLHKCDNRRCINPEHLFTGTAKDNSMDMAAKGRSCRGEKNSKSKLTDNQIRNIRFRAASKKEMLKDIAADYDVRYATVYNVLAGKTWRHVT